MTLRRGDRVTTPNGLGIVNYVRMDHLGDPTTIAAVSVFLDARLTRPGYEGTIYPAAKVTKVALRYRSDLGAFDVDRDREAYH